MCVALTRKLLANVSQQRNCAVVTPERLRYPEPELTDGVVRLRKWAEDDLACVEEASHDHTITEGTTVPPVFSPEEGRAFVHRQWSRITDGVAISLAIADVDTNRAQGLVILPMRPQAGVAGLGYWLAASARPSYRRAGLFTHPLTAEDREPPQDSRSLSSRRAAISRPTVPITSR